MTYIPPGMQNQPKDSPATKEKPPAPATTEYSSEAIDKQINDIAAMQNPCNQVGEFFEEIAAQIDELTDKFDAIVDVFVDKIANTFGIPAVIVRWAVDYVLIKLGIKKDFQPAEVFKGAGGGPGGPAGSQSFPNEIEALYALGAQSIAFLREQERLKRKYGNLDPKIDDILDDPAKFVRELGGDFERLCNMIPNWEKAKNGGLKVTVAKHGLGFPIDLIEILEEGISPFIKRLEKFLLGLEFQIDLIHEEYAHVDSKADGKCSHTDL